MPDDSRVAVARQQCHQRRRALGCVCRHFPCESIAACHPGFSTHPSGAIAIGRPERLRSTGHVTKMLNQFEIIELDVLDGARASVPRQPRSAHLRGGELEYRCNRCLCLHLHIVTHLHAETGVSWCQFRSPIETTWDSSHQCVKLTRRNTPATPLASQVLQLRAFSDQPIRVCTHRSISWSQDAH
jgi:hypothetical protein